MKVCGSPQTGSFKQFASSVFHQDAQCCMVPKAQPTTVRHSGALTSCDRGLIKPEKPATSLASESALFGKILSVG